MSIATITIVTNSQSALPLALFHLRVRPIGGLGNTQREARELISGPCLRGKTTHLSFNRTQSRVVIGLLTGHNTLRRYLHLMGLSHRPLCWRCAAQDKILAYILCECEALTSLRLTYLCSCFLDQEEIKSIVWGPSGTSATSNSPIIQGSTARRW